MCWYLRAIMASKPASKAWIGKIGPARGRCFYRQLVVCPYLLGVAVETAEEEVDAEIGHQYAGEGYKQI